MNCDPGTARHRRGATIPRSLTCSLCISAWVASFDSPSCQQSKPSMKMSQFSSFPSSSSFPFGPFHSRSLERHLLRDSWARIQENVSSSFLQFFFFVNLLYWNREEQWPEGSSLGFVSFLFVSLYYYYLRAKRNDRPSLVPRYR